jgi:glutamine synthetase type I
MNKVSFEVDAQDAAWNTDTEYEMGNMGHRPGVKGGYFPVNPTDAAMDLRSEMLSTMKRIGMKVDKHHHEVASCQHELGLIFSSLTKQADELQKYKYVIHNVAHAYGKSATFMPKPIAGDNGTGMHVNMSIWKDGKPLFAGDKYADLSDEALYFIGGILKHAKTLNAFTNPSTNSYKRLIPGFEAPVLRAYSARNRSGCVRIPWTESPKAKRVEARFPDPSANPYLCICGAPDGRSRRDREQDPPGRAVRQGPLRSAARRAGRHPHGLRVLARSPGIARGRSRLPAQGRRVHQGPDRGLHGAQVGRGLRLRAHPHPVRCTTIDGPW